MVVMLVCWVLIYVGGFKDNIWYVFFFLVFLSENENMLKIFCICNYFFNECKKNSVIYVIINVVK